MDAFTSFLNEIQDESPQEIHEVENYLSSMSPEQLNDVNAAVDHAVYKESHVVPMSTSYGTVNTGQYPHGLTQKEADILNKAAAVEHAGRALGRAKLSNAFASVARGQQDMLENRTARGIHTGAGLGLVGAGIGGLAGLALRKGSDRAALMGASLGGGIGAIGGTLLGTRMADAERKARLRRGGVSFSDTPGVLETLANQGQESRQHVPMQTTIGGLAGGAAGGLLGHALGGTKGALIGGGLGAVGGGILGNLEAKAQKRMMAEKALEASKQSSVNWSDAIHRAAQRR